MEGDTEREIDNQDCAWPSTSWWMLRLTPSQVHLRHGCPWGRRQLPCYIRAPVTSPLGWKTDIITGSCRRCPAPPAPPTPAQFSPLLRAPVPELLLKPHAGMLPGVCVWNQRPFFLPLHTPLCHDALGSSEVSSPASLWSRLFSRLRCLLLSVCHWLLFFYHLL